MWTWDGAAPTLDDEATLDGFLEGEASAPPRRGRLSLGFGLGLFLAYEPMTRRNFIAFVIVAAVDGAVNP